MADKPNLNDVAGCLPQMLRYARALARDPAAAEDLVQGALERAYARRATFRDGGDLRAWLLATLHNHFVSTERQKRASVRREAAVARDAAQTAEPSQEHAAELALVQAAFRRLSDDHRAVLHLVSVEGLSYPETAEALGLPVGTVMSRLSRARAALREQLGEPDVPSIGGQTKLKVVGGKDEL
ncbi:sigma-70 family RNA polymerase sigma factor [Phenylobacterium sp.]|jgi:RNA polymerase sigma factor (sigma-70 family)|uniref:sigma-70 family RNA polymerase sigma factor n=1 Tax=Phenylobacterium sp. TaxID=1871053 RepID=UPI0037838563